MSDWFKLTVVFASGALMLVACTKPDSPAAPVDLRCEGQVNPMAAPERPYLSWRIEPLEGVRGQKQSAWQILAASSREKLDRDEGDLWDSGKRSSSRSPRIAYEGIVPPAGQRCFWKVRFWESDGLASAWSQPSHWDVALIHPADWQGARWIDDGKANPTRDEDFYKEDPSPLMRGKFNLDRPVAQARLHVAGLGLCIPSLNGTRLSDHVFDPAWTHFEKRILYRTHDVTDHLQNGENCLGLTLGNGWYNPLPLRMWGHRNIREALPVGRPRGIACLVVDHTDGTRTVITTGPEWTTTEGPTLRNSLYLGEVRDARRALPGWDHPEFDDSTWRPVQVTDHPLTPLRPLAMHPVRLGSPVSARDVTTPAPGVFVVDFGRNLTGLPEIDLNVPAGTRITFRFGELLYSDGRLNPMTAVCGQIKGSRELPDGSRESVGGPGAPEIAWQEDIYIARGGGAETYRPDFTFHGFRYMEITGLPDAPEVSAFRAYPMGTELPDAGHFSCSNDLLNQIQHVCRDTFLANVVSVQSDCPHRERFGYGGDIVATSEAFIMNFDMAGFYSKTVRDWGDAVRPDGRLTDTAPFVGVDYCGVGWAMVHPLLLDQLHQYYGIRDLVDEQLPTALRWLEVEAARREQALVTKGLGDHEALIPAKGPEFTTPMFVDSARRLERLTRITGDNSQTDQLTRWAEESASAWADAFLNPETGQVGVGTQSAQTFALGFGAAAPETREKVFARLVEDLTKAGEAPRLSTGIYGTRILLEELPQNGRNDLAYALATRETFPSWGWMLQNGATTLWEAWEGGEGSRSHNHPMFGSLSTWFFRWLGGIQPAGDAIGFDRILIRPQVVPDLEWVKCSHDSVRGTITSNWSHNERGTEFEIIIPPDTTAIIELPGSINDITESGQPLTRVGGLKSLPDARPGTTRLQAASGYYHFKTLKIIRPVEG